MELLAAKAIHANNVRAMATQPDHTAKPDSRPGEALTDRQPLPPSPPTLPVLRFGLRQLFWTVTALSLLLAAIATSPNRTATMLLLLAGVIVATHVTATAIGSRLRRHAQEARDWELYYGLDGRSAVEKQEHSRDPGAAQSRPRSPWHFRGSTALRWLPKLVIAGAVVGGVAGAALFLTDALGRSPSPAGIIVGAISLAVLGGWLAFLMGSFYAIVRHGVLDAMAQQDRDHSSRGLPQ